jgi:hypothetical protein
VPTTNAKTFTAWLQKQSKNMAIHDVPEVSEQEAATARVVHWLVANGVEFADPADIPMSLIDEKKSRANQARRDPIVQESVDRFATAMKAGVVFPPVVAYKDGGRLVLIDGNNRQAAARKAGKDVLWGIVIAEDTASELIQLLTVEANAHHGVTPELSWRLQQAEHLASLGCYSDLDAARAAGVTPNQLSMARKVRDAEMRAKNMKVSGFASLPTYAKQALAPLKDDEVFVRAAKTAVDTRMTIDEIREMTRGVRGQNSEGSRIKFIEQIAKDRGAQAARRRAEVTTTRPVGGHVRGYSPKTALLASLLKLNNVKEEALVKNVTTRHDYDRVVTAIETAQEKLLQLQVALEQVKGLGEDEG